MSEARSRDPHARRRRRHGRDRSPCSSRSGARSTPIVDVELLRAIAHAGGYVAGAFESGNIVGASFGFLARHDGERGAAQPRHRHPARRPAQRRRPGDEEPPAGVGGRTRHRLDHLDVRPARAAQRLVQHRGARRPRHRVPRELLRLDDRLDQRPRRVRPPDGRLADRSDRRPGRPARRIGASSRSPRPTTSSCCAAPTRPAPTNGATRCATSWHRCSPPAASSPASPATASTSSTPQPDRSPTCTSSNSSCDGSRSISSPRSAPASASRRAATSCCCMSPPTSATAGASAWRGASRPTRRSTSTPPSS